MPDTNPPSAAVVAVLAEREKQRSKWTERHDDDHAADGMLYRVASYMVNPEEVYPPSDWARTLILRKSPRERLVIAAALLIAEIERRDRSGE